MASVRRDDARPCRNSASRRFIDTAAAAMLGGIVGGGALARFAAPLGVESHTQANNEKFPAFNSIEMY